MSVDTYLKGKDTSSYQRVHLDDVELLIAPNMARWSRSVHVDTRGAWLWRGFDVEVDHEPGPACSH